MSNTELNNQPDYNDLDKNIDKNVNKVEDNIQNAENVKINDNLIQFFKEVVVLFVTIFVWGFLGSVGIFWLKRAANQQISKNNNYSINCYKQNDDGQDIVSYLDIYFPYNPEKLPYSSPNDSCNPKLEDIAPITNSGPCSNEGQRAFVKKYTDNAKTKIKSLDFPYNLLDTTNNYNQLKDPETDTFYKQMIPLVKIIYKDGFKNPFVCSRRTLNQIFTYTGGKSKWWLNEQFLMIFMKLVFALIIFIKFFSGLFIPIYEVIKTFYANKNFKIPGIWFCAWAAKKVFQSGNVFGKSDDSSNINNSNANWKDHPKKGLMAALNIIIKVLNIIIKVLLFIFLFLPTFALDILIIALFSIIFLIVFGPLFGFIFMVSLLSIFVQLFSLFEGAIRSGKLTEIFKCNTNLLIFIFGFFVFMSAKHNLDPYMFKFIGISYVLYVCYTLFKLFIS